MAKFTDTQWQNVYKHTRFMLSFAGSLLKHILVNFNNFRHFCATINSHGLAKTVLTRQRSQMTHLPKEIEKLLKNEEYTIDKIGMSGSTVMVFGDKVLKIQNATAEAENEVALMRWLNSKLPVPQVLAHECMDGKSFLLMSKLKGKMACAQRFLQCPQLLFRLLGEALNMWWSVDFSAYSKKSNLNEKLRVAQHAVEDNLVDLNNVEPNTFGENGFENPQALLNWLVKNRPAEEDLVLSHGDFCLPNVFLTDDGVSGFIDLGRGGVADKYQDVALCYRSLKSNFGGRYGGPTYNVDMDMFFKVLKIEPDWEKMKYYLLLDELF